MKSNECYLTKYLQEKLNKKDDSVIENLEKFRYYINECTLYDGKLKGYDDIAPKLINELEDAKDEELNSLAYDRILRINSEVAKTFEKIEKVKENIPEEKESYDNAVIDIQKSFINDVREFELFVAILKYNNDEINKLLPKIERGLKEETEKIPDLIQIDNVTYKRVMTYAKR